MNFRIHLFISTSFLLLLFSINLQIVLAAVKTSQTSGNWSNVGSWGSSVPADNDDVIISSGTVINLNSALPSTSSLKSLIIQSGATLIVTVNGSTLRIKGDIINDGVLNLWQSSSLQASVILYGKSYWSGNGQWNLSSVNIQNNALELSPGLGLVINGDLSSDVGGSFNQVNKHRGISLTFQGTANSSLPSNSSSFYYGDLIVDKTSGALSFLSSATSNSINFYGNLVLVDSTDRINLGSFNTLTIHNSVTGNGVISGGFTSSLIVDDVDKSTISPLRMLSGTSLKNFVVNRAAGVVLSTGFNVRDSLILNNNCRLVLSNQTLSLGVNGTTPTPGSFSGNGCLVGSAASSISVRGSNLSPTNLRFGRLNPSEYTVNNLVIDKTGGSTGLLDSCSLIVKGTFTVLDNNNFAIGPASLTLNSVSSFSSTGCLKGSEASTLIIGGTGTTPYGLQFDQSTTGGHTLKTYIQSRKVPITLLNSLRIAGEVNLTGSPSVLVSNGNLTLLSTETQSSGIGPLLNSADVTGDVNVQVYLSGDNTSMKFRGYRSLSSPLNDNLIPPTAKRSLAQLKDFIIITGPGGTSNGFDQGGIAQPYAVTLQMYNPFAHTDQIRFNPVNNITQPLSQGAGFLTFFRGRQMGSYTQNYQKLNFPYSAPEPVTLVFSGPINKFDLPPITLRQSSDTADVLRGYNLLGNPYPSAIDWTKVSHSAGVNDEVIIIKPGGGAATYINGISNNGGSPIIQTGQGFYVRATVDSSTVTFTEACKTSVYPARLLTKPLSNDLLAVNNSSEQLNRISSASQILRFNIYSSEDEEETTVVFNAGETENADYHDAVYFAGSNVSLASFSADNKKLAINFMPELNQVKHLNLSVNATSAGSYHLKFTEIPKSSIAIFLKDSLLPNQLLELNDKFIYPFVIDRKIPETYGDNRFSLVFKERPKKESSSDYKVTSILAYPNPAIREVFFDSSALPTVNKQVLIYDLLGRKRKSLSFRAGEDIKADLSLIEPGLYIAKFISDGDGKFLGESLIVKY